MMNFKILTFAAILISSFGFAQHKIEKCNKLAESEQRVCKDNVIANLISDYVEYPKNAMDNQNEGVIYVRFTTDQNQNLKSVRVLGEPDEDLANAAKIAIEKFANSDGKMILAQNEVYRIPVKFVLE